MYFSDRIKLRAVTTTRNTYGEPIASYTDTEVWANKGSATRSEFYAANANGITIAIVFEVHAEDYSDQSIILFGSTQYDVARAFQKGEGIVQLNCTVRETS